MQDDQIMCDLLLPLCSMLQDKGIQCCKIRDSTISIKNSKRKSYQSFAPDAEVGAVFDLDGAARPRRRRPVRFTDVTARRHHSGGKLSIEREFLVSTFCSGQCSAKTNCRSDWLDNAFSKSCCKIMS